MDYGIGTRIAVDFIFSELITMTVAVTDPDFMFLKQIIDLLMGLSRGAVFRHGGGTRKQPHGWTH